MYILSVDLERYMASNLLAYPSLTCIASCEPADWSVGQHSLVLGVAA